MNELTAQSVPRFEERFHRCDDGVLRRVSIAYRCGENRPSEISIVISVMDKETTESRGWVNLLLEMTDVREFSFCEGDTSYQILSNGLSIKQIEGLYYIHFHPVDEPASVEDFRNSKFYTVAKTISWEVLPYNEEGRMPHEPPSNT